MALFYGWGSTASRKLVGNYWESKIVDKIFQWVICHVKEVHKKNCSSHYEQL